MTLLDDRRRRRAPLDSQASTAAIQRALQAEGDKGGGQSIRKHRPTPNKGHGTAVVTYISPEGAVTVEQGLDARGRPIDSID